MSSKKLFLFLMLVPLHFISYCQLQKLDPQKFVSVGRWKMGARVLSEMYYSVDGKDTTYHWQYDDQRYSQITSYEWIDFTEEGSTFNDLYSLLKDCFDREVGYQASFKLGEIPVTVEVQKSMGTKYLFVTPTTGYFTLMRKGLDKLFGKN